MDIVQKFGSMFSFLFSPLISFLEKVMNFLSPPLPTEAELRAGKHTHKEGCDRNPYYDQMRPANYGWMGAEDDLDKVSNFQIETREDIFTLHGMWNTDVTTKYNRHFLKCMYCHVEAEFRETN